MFALVVSYERVCIERSFKETSASFTFGAELQPERIAAGVKVMQRINVMNRFANIIQPPVLQGTAPLKA